MKKTLIAVAALAATSAFAQNVTISGTFDATYRADSVDYQNGTSGSQQSIGRDGSGTTGVIFSGMEDLGGGLKAVFLYEHNFDVNNSTATATGQAFVGVEGAFGSLKFGTANSPTLTVQGARTAFGTKDGGRAGLINNGTVFGAANSNTLMGVAVTRTPQSIVYATPNFSGFSVVGSYSFVGNKADNNAATTVAGTGNVTDIGLFYSNGPIAAGVTNYSVGEGTTAAGVPNAGKVGQTSYYGSYNFGVAKLTLGGQNTKQAGVGGAEDVKASGFSANVDVPLSPALTLSAAVQKLNDKTTDNNDISMTAVGVNYALSKRTSTYARYVTESIDNTTVATDVKDANRFLVGLRHNF